MNDAIDLGVPDLGILGDEEAFDGDHLAEAAVVLIADGAGSLVSDRVRDHAEGCAKCAACVAEEALGASELQTAFAGMSVVAREQLVRGAGEQLVRGAEKKVSASAGVRRHVALISRDTRVREEPKTAELATATIVGSEPSAARKRARGGGWWIAVGLLIAGLASAPSLSGLAKGISEVREALLVVVAVSVQAEQALRVASGRMQIVRTTASWTAALVMVGVGLWIARRDPKRANALANEMKSAKKVEGAR